MKPKFLHVLFTCAVGLLFIGMCGAVISYVLGHRKTASTQAAKVATYDPTPGRYASRTRLEFSTVPERLQAGELAIWSVKIVDQKEKDRHGQPKYVRSYVQEGGNLVNLVAVSDDLSTFKRFPLDYKDYGHFLLQTSLPHAGTYRLYADYIPYGGTREVKQQTIEVGGTPGSRSAQTAMPVATENLAVQLVNVQADDAQGSDAAFYQVELQTSRMVSNRKTQLHFTVRDAAGNTVVDLEPYFGARAQCVAISLDGQTYLHPELKASAAKPRNIVFETQFPHAGRYKVWLQFQQRKSVVTAPFVIKVVDADRNVGKETANARAAKKG